VTTTQRQQQQGRVAPAYFIITAIFELGSMNFSRLTYLHFIIARPFYWRKSFSLFLCVYVYPSTRGFYLPSGIWYFISDCLGIYVDVYSVCLFV